jgi:hypothetical protein
MTERSEDALKANEYQCSMCGGIFEEGWSEEEATAELGETFPGASKASCAVVCDDCYKQVMGWAETPEGRDAYEAALNLSSGRKA